MSQSYRSVRLLKNKLYPTYQLFAVMGNKKTSPTEGLRIAALTTIEWLRHRLGDDIPHEIADLPVPSAYRELDSKRLSSFHMNCGFVLDVVSLPDMGLWTLQITEPDLGSDPGNPEQERPAIPGRVIETNIGFRICGSALECGFQTVISDPAGTETSAEVYRLAVVRELLRNPDFGLRQITPISEKQEEVISQSQLKTALSLTKDENNQLPSVIFTYLRSKQPYKQPDLNDIMSHKTGELPKIPFNVTETMKRAAPVTETTELPYDVQAFAHNTAGFSRTYILSDSLLDKFSDGLGAKVQPGSIVVIEPSAFGGGVRQIEYKVNRSRREEALSALQSEMRSYPCGRAVRFGHIRFLSAARESLLSETQEALHEASGTAQEWEQRLQQLNAQWQLVVDEKDQAYQALCEQLDRQREYQARLEREKETLREENAQALRKAQVQLADKDEEIAYFKRKNAQPKEHGEIASWVEHSFAGRLFLHPKAVTLLEDKSARDIDIHLICDALDFLATDYRDCRYQEITKDDMLLRCSEKYGRPFEVKPTGDITIEFTPTQYKIKYFPGAKGKPVESPLDYHLCVGNDPENLLRIYFLHDDEKKQIVVGSLPRHLRAVTIR